MGIVEQYLLQLNTEKRRLRRAAAILTVLSLFVAIGVSWNLRMVGITSANEASCGQKEHRHSEECVDTQVLVCGYPDEPEETQPQSTQEALIPETEAPTEQTEAPTEQTLPEMHVHTEECYQITYRCGIDEHTHALACYSDPSADLETVDIWESSLPLPEKYTEDWTDNLILIAQSQVGNRESEQNYIVADDGITKKGITRYGQWYGNPYGDWSSMFLMFCLHYADISEDVIPRSPGVYNMMRMCEEQEILSLPDEYTSAFGNILFLDTDENENADRILIVMDASDKEILAIGGDWEDAVAEVIIPVDDPRILGYLHTNSIQQAYLQSLPLYSIGKSGNTYNIDVYAIPFDSDGNRITELAVTNLARLEVNQSNKTQVSSRFDTTLGTYQSAYFGSETSVNEDNIATVWRYQSGRTYYLAFARTDGSQNQRWKDKADNSISLYLRYIPEFTVTFKSEGYTPLTERVEYKRYATLSEPASWTREGYSLVGWSSSNDQNVYSYEEVLARPVTSDITYTAVWRSFVEVRFDLGEYADALYPIDPIEISYGGTLSPLPTPGWRNNTAAMAFDGWYLNSELTQPVTSEYEFYEDSTLYAKWSPKEDGYYVYFMDFVQENQTPLVLMTYSVTEGKTTSAYAPGHAPVGFAWDGKWYLDTACANVYNFTTPVSQMTDYLTGANNRDLYLYPGTKAVCRAIFVTYGSKIDPVSVPVGGSIDLNQYVPQRYGYEFAGWTLKDGTPVSGKQTLDENTTFYATWSAGYVPFEAILRIENPNDTGMTQADILGTWYAKAGSQIRVKSSYSGSDTSRTGSHTVVCVLDGVEYPVYTNAALTSQAKLNDVYSTYFLYNNTGTNWTDEVNWDDVYTGGELPYSTRPISSAGDTIINFDYMRLRRDITFIIPNTNSGGYIDVYKLYQNGLITGSVTYTGTKPSAVGSNVSATGVSAENISWSYTAASNIGTNQKNYYILHNMKYGQRVFEVYPVGTSWLTPRSSNVGFHQYEVGSGQLFASRREDLTADFFSGSGRKVTAYDLTAEFESQEKIALMYAVECLSGETADFTINGKGYKVQTQLCEVVNHTGGFGIKDLKGCEAGVNVLGTNDNSNYYTKLGSTTATVGGTSVKTLFGEKYWEYYNRYVGSVSNINRAYIFCYDRLYMNIQLSFAYDSNGDGVNESVEYENIAYGENISEYQFGAPDWNQHPLLEREGYEFAGWLDANGFVLEAEDWAGLVATGDSDSGMIFIAKWEKISNNIVEYYEDVSSSAPFESHYFDDGDMLQYPTMTVYPEGWVWQEYGLGSKVRFDWDVPMYGEYGVQEVRTINGEERVVNVIRIYGAWDESHTRVVYDPNAAQGGIPGTAPTDSNEYTIWQSEVSVKSPESLANTASDMVFAGWLLDRNGIVYHPGDHVPVQWPRTMIFTAQWAKREEIVYLRYDSNGGTPNAYYPNETGIAYKKNAAAFVWDNTEIGGEVWFTRPGYKFKGWNTEPDGGGTSYAPGSNIVLTQSQTTLYAQWESTLFTLSVYKVDFDGGRPLSGAIFGLYSMESGEPVPIGNLTTGADGHIVFPDLQTNLIYKLVEERPPDGYATIAKEIFFRLVPENNTVTFTFCDSAGRSVSPPTSVTGEYITGSQLLILHIQNLRGYELPSTGGIGTPIYILSGLALSLAPLVYGLSLRRRYERRSKR